MNFRDLINEELRKTTPDGKKKTTVRRLAEDIGVSPSHIVYLRKELDFVRPKTLAKLAAYFETSGEKLLSGRALTKEIMAIITRMNDEEKSTLLDYLRGKAQGDAKAGPAKRIVPLKGIIPGVDIPEQDISQTIKRNRS